LAGDKVLVTTLRGLKAAILNIEVAEGLRSQGLSDEAVTVLFQKEAKKRQESADLFGQGGNVEKQQAELLEKRIITNYLPTQLTEDEIVSVVNGVIDELDVSGMQAMGQVMGVVKAKLGGRADSALVAKIVKEKLS